MTTAEPGYTAPDATLLNAEHVARYRETNGEVGYIWNGVTILLLTTTGRKSGQPRTTPLIFAKDGDDFLVVASQGGAPTHPLWFLNLEADPKAEVQVLDQTIPVLGRAASEQEKPRLWEIVSAAWPNYHVYQTRTTRPIPVVVLTPRG
ncbi:nitroreductase family deazaflavin-dependent oxidoreductase [Frankia sp. AgPm24]|uniref:nitroreductase family deazaflavin-dependent oxidoreductase n=1 Tax=Frankia sp. AgPm24 TaxID=631128 RepID=UPI00200EEBE0|nr:nitroreductase family deazaflavin-dependent oxidoreductase [Frankia sp. AgPm24]MCK9922976.1 nitroreductase family deazaflavin-dependent oxidoreductase [Frankia sp. AgPm24]